MKKNKERKITFVYSDAAEKSIYEPIASVAISRGYSVAFTSNPFERCDIGFYCQHCNFPQYSRISVIMLHDIIQQYSNWPDIWYREPWNKYDIGILPSYQWVKNWDDCSQWYYSRPRVGVFMIGWPKADKVANIKESVYKKDFFSKYGLDESKKTILYAPAWENDGKQDDFVRAMLPLNVNILIKQAPWNENEYPQQIRNIAEMNMLHKGITGVTILDPKLNIFEAIAVSDILVSEESSTMCEAVMMGIPAVSVSDWLIPDVTPSRYPSCQYDFVFKTTKDKLQDCIVHMLDNYSVYKEKTVDFSKRNFGNIGHTSSMIMDIIDDICAQKVIRYEALVSQKKEKMPFSQYFQHTVLRLKKAFVNNYSVQYPVLGKGISFLRKEKHRIIRKR